MMRRVIGKLGAAALLLCAAVPARGQTHLVIVSGLGGQPQYTRSFAQLSTSLAQAANERWGLPESAIIWLGDTAAPKSKWYRGVSLRDNIDQTLARIAERPPAEQVVLVFIGHGSGEGDDTRVSLPGPDMTARDFARVLTRFGTRRVAFINLTSASGDMLPLLAGPGRVVVTATKSAFERNESQFARFFIDALSGDGADTDKDARVSLFEAFAYAERETKRYYETESRLATEHAQIADEGQLARRFFLAAGTATRAAPDARVAALYAERQSLDEQLQALKQRKRSMSQDAYERDLERVLLAIALKGREIRQAERGS
jgi:hypothetical protein